MKAIVLQILEINQFQRRNCLKARIKRPPQIIVLQFLFDFLKCLLRLGLMTGIQFFELRIKNFQENICIWVIYYTRAILGNFPKIFISQSSKMNHCWHLYTCCFIKHIPYRFSLIIDAHPNRQRNFFVQRLLQLLPPLHHSKVSVFWRNTQKIFLRGMKRWRHGTIAERAAVRRNAKKREGVCRCRGNWLTLQSQNGRIPEWPNGADCKSAGLYLRWFESIFAHWFLTYEINQEIN